MAFIKNRVIKYGSSLDEFTNPKTGDIFVITIDGEEESKPLSMWEWKGTYWMIFPTNLISKNVSGFMTLNTSNDVTDSWHVKRDDWVSRTTISFPTASSFRISSKSSFDIGSDVTYNGNTGVFTIRRYMLIFDNSELIYVGNLLREVNGVISDGASDTIIIRDEHIPVADDYPELGIEEDYMLNDLLKAIININTKEIDLTASDEMLEADKMLYEYRCLYDFQVIDDPIISVIEAPTGSSIKMSIAKNDTFISVLNGFLEIEENETYSTNEHDVNGVTFSKGDKLSVYCNFVGSVNAGTGAKMLLKYKKL